MDSDDDKNQPPPEPAAGKATAAQRLRREAWMWLVSALLIAPVALLYVSHYVHAYRDGMHPTGFIQYDMPVYMANAREHFDDGPFALAYSNPASLDSDSPKIYFQPITLVHALILYFFQADPGTLFVVTGAVFCLAAVRVAIALFEEICGLDTKAKRFTLVCFIWSGGLMVAAGAGRAFFTGDWTFEGLFHFRPIQDQGWWLLNFGRNLGFPTEAMYHALSLGCVVLFCRKRFATAIACLTLLAVSHAYTGTQFILIFIVWLALEKYFWRNQDVPFWALASTLGIALVHFWYYLGFLPSFDEHAELMSQLALDWSIKARTMIPAWGMVALLAVWRMRNPELAAQTLTDASNRLLVVWFFVSFLLANHEFAMTPHQPLHFTHGYVWMPLFLLGAPTLIAVFDRMLSVRHIGGLLICMLMAVLLMDNAVWFAGRCRWKTGRRITPDEHSLLQYLDTVPENLLIIGESERIGYFATVYTKHRAWNSHNYFTHNREQRIQEIADFLTMNAIPAEWENRAVAIVLSKSSDHFPIAEQLERMPSWPPPCYENSSFRVVRTQFDSDP